MGDALAKPERKPAHELTTVDLFALTRGADANLTTLIRRGGGGFSADLEEFRQQLAAINDRVKALEIGAAPAGHWMAEEIRQLHDKLRFAAIRDERVERAVHHLEAATGCKILTDSQGNIRIISPDGKSEALLPTGYTAHIERKQLGE